MCKTLIAEPCCVYPDAGTRKLTFTESNQKQKNKLPEKQLTICRREIEKPFSSVNV